MINSTQHSGNGKCLQFKFFTEVVEDVGGGGGGSRHCNAAVQGYDDVIQCSNTFKAEKSCILRNSDENNLDRH